MRQKQILKKSLLFFPKEALMNRCNILSTNGRNLNERVKFYTNPSLFIQIETLNL